MIEKMMNLNYFTYKKPFSGSDKGNRFKYVIQMQEVEEKKVLHVMCYVGEKNSKETPDEIKKFKDFEFSEEGYKEALDWLSIESDKIDT
ncbi:MAG: hypothetical protein SPE25_02865 [Lachnospiraceae bacterium]|nr:hypothetical protein [Lachnospiraceae bacterium]MDD7223838.1 hypothetical protein [Lachnospiraceae bacterium]MDY3254526.1 hypothetical protein [Lachnospiraceae bacterium]MDY4427944.1 hypothetical protein [Lachnospiraceae bacterium]MDY5640180.1 hypothetical protein [Lachnospiraceae bacterium]